MGEERRKIVTDTRLYLAIGVPVIMNAAMLTLAVTLMGKRLDDMKDLWARRTAPRGRGAGRPPQAPGGKGMTEQWKKDIEDARSRQTPVTEIGWFSSQHSAAPARAAPPHLPGTGLPGRL